jgi:hypothetical protein
MIFGYIGGMCGYFMFGFTKTGLLLFLGIPVLRGMKRRSQRLEPQKLSSPPTYAKPPKPPNHA